MRSYGVKQGMDMFMEQGVKCDDSREGVRNCQRSMREVIQDFSESK